MTQLEIMPMPPQKENKALSWPHWPMKLRVSTSQAEGAKTEYSINTTGFSGENGMVKKLHYVRVDAKMQPVKGTRRRVAGRPRAARHGLFRADRGRRGQGAGSEAGRAWPLQGAGRRRARRYRVEGASPKLFAAGDIRRGQSLVVWAIREGRQAAHAIDLALMGRTDLPR